MSTLLCARAASAHSPLRFSEKLSARIGRTRLRQFVCPSQPVLKKGCRPKGANPLAKRLPKPKPERFSHDSVILPPFPAASAHNSADRTHPYADWYCSIWFPVPDCSTSPDSDRAPDARRATKSRTASVRTDTSGYAPETDGSAQTSARYCGALSGTPAHRPCRTGFRAD